MGDRLSYGLAVLLFAAVVCVTPCRAQSPQSAPGIINGAVVDPSGAVVSGARVDLSQNATEHDGAGRDGMAEDRPRPREVLSDSDGQFSFANVAPGPFQLTVTSPGFEMKTSAGVLLAGEIHTVPQIALSVAEKFTDVQVSLTPTQVAEAQIKDEEKQRVLGVIPNFYVTYDPHPLPLDPRQKFELAWKTTIDPVNLAIVGAIAGVEQAMNDFSGYGQGSQGYAKRYGAAFADGAIGTFIGSAILPSLLKQDPRYFYKGTGTKRSRILYAIANAVICKGDNGRWQANYSSILGNLGAGGISNLYYPSQSRHGLGLTFANAAIGTGANAGTNLVEEFLMRRFTPKLPKHEPATP
jgi:hypothetical protein